MRDMRIVTRTFPSEQNDGCEYCVVEMSVAGADWLLARMREMQGDNRCEPYLEEKVYHVPGPGGMCAYFVGYNDDYPFDLADDGPVFFGDREIDEELTVEPAVYVTVSSRAVTFFGFVEIVGRLEAEYINEDMLQAIVSGEAEPVTEDPGRYSAMPDPTDPEESVFVTDSAAYTWCFEDQRRAQAEGWDIFETNRDASSATDIVDGKPYGERPYEIQAIDDPGEGVTPLVGDKVAWEHVLGRRQRHGSDSLYGRAFAFLKANSPLEYRAILEHGKKTGILSPGFDNCENEGAEVVVDRPAGETPKAEGSGKPAAKASGNGTTYLLYRMGEAMTLKCLACGTTTEHPVDVAERYCPSCRERLE